MANNPTRGSVTFTRLVLGFSIMVVIKALFSYQTSSVAVVFGYLLGLFIYSFLLGIIPYIFLRNKLSNPKTVIFGIALIIIGSVSYWGNRYEASQGDSLGSTEVKEIATDKGVENSEIVGNLYRNKKYGFRIKFPEGWKITNGDGAHIVQKATKGYVTIAILVQQVDLGKEKGVDSIKEVASLEEIVTGKIEEANQKFSNVKLLGSGETKIDNEPAYWVEYSSDYQALDVKVSTTNIEYTLFKDDTLYSVFSGADSKAYLATKPEIIKSVMTFVFEK